MTPLENETQPQFAIRFHDAMTASIPGVAARNEACDQAWLSTNGPMTERQIARDHYSADEFKLVEDVPVFREHKVPDSQSANGETIPGLYDKYSLAAMCDNMNSRIRDTSNFSPISLGHTSPDKPEPELLGFSGAMRLRMMGNENPVFGIVTDEYRRLDKVEDFKSLPGRSPEVWKYKRFEDRFFAPIAALGVTTPRLDLPPAQYSADAPDNEIAVDRYERAIDIDDVTFDEHKVEIDRYMTAMGGSNAYTPPMGHYGQPNQGGEMPADQGRESLVYSIMEALTQTQQWQFLTHLMQQGGMESSSAPPAVQSPVDRVDDLPGRPAPPQPPQPAAQQPQAPQEPGLMTDSQNPQQYGRDAEFTELLAANAALQKRVEQLEGVGQREKYARRLDALSQTHLLNTDEELNRVCEMTPEDAESHFGVIAEHYQRNPHAIPELDVYQKSGEPGIRLEADGGLPKDLSEQVTKYAMKNGLDWAEARAAFLKDHAPAVPAA